MKAEVAVRIEMVSLPNRGDVQVRNPRAKMVRIQNLRHKRMGHVFVTEKSIPKSKSLLLIALTLACALELRAQSTGLAGIAHVAFRVNDLDKSEAFYHTLGFERAFQFTDNGKTSVVFLKVNDRQFIELYPRTAESQAGALMHICFESSDIEALQNVYLKRGLKPTDVKRARAGNLLFVMHDPEGQLLEYTQYQPESLHSLDRGKHLGPTRISQHLFEATIPASDPAAQRVFYTGELAFHESAPNSNELLIAGASGDEVELQPPAAKPRITFLVANVAQAERDLQKRGLKVEKGQDSVYVTDPDGAVIGFVSSRRARTSGQL
jgi:catechol 2,3-dioxygenase-like lactoylglutathione lyase family enzyme